MDYGNRAVRDAPSFVALAPKSTEPARIRDQTFRRPTSGSHRILQVGIRMMYGAGLGSGDVGKG